MSNYMQKREEWLTERDPDWRDHFNDVDIAYDFYLAGLEPKAPTKTIDCGREEPGWVVPGKQEDWEE